MMISAVLILPAALRDAGNQLSIAMGRDDPPGHTYVVPLSADGQAPVTHYGCHAWVTDGFQLMIETAKDGTFPDWPPEMTALAQLVIGGLISSFKQDGETTPAEHFSGVLDANGLIQLNVSP